MEQTTFSTILEVTVVLIIGFAIFFALSAVGYITTARTEKVPLKNILPFNKTQTIEEKQKL